MWRQTFAALHLPGTNSDGNRRKVQGDAGVVPRAAAASIWDGAEVARDEALGIERDETGARLVARQPAALDQQGAQRGLDATTGTGGAGRPAPDDEDIHIRHGAKL